MNNSKGMNKYRPPNQRPKKFVRPNSASGNSKRMKASITLQQKSYDFEDNNYNNINNNNEPKISMFDEYYKNRMENKNYNINSNNSNYNSINLQDNQNNNNYNNIYLNNHENQIMEQENQINNDNNNQDINIENNNEIKNNKNKIIQRPLTTKNKEKNIKIFCS